MDKKMKAWGITHYKQENLQLFDLPLPDIKSDEVLVEVYAASINPLDFKIKNGDLKMILDYKMPLILGNDFSGVVKSVGSQVTDFRPGDEVYGRPRQEPLLSFWLLRQPI